MYLSTITSITQQDESGKSGADVYRCFQSVILHDVRRTCAYHRIFSRSPSIMPSWKLPFMNPVRMQVLIIAILPTLVVLRRWVLRFLRFVDATVPSSYLTVR